jgi:hypothetical protein
VAGGAWHLYLGGWRVAQQQTHALVLTLQLEMHCTLRPMVHGIGKAPEIRISNAILNSEL